MALLPPASTLGVFVLAALVLLVIPGPAVLYIVGRSIEHGRRAGFLSVLGIVTGTLVHVIAAALGLSALLMASSAALAVVKYAGAAYLMWLGARALAGGERRELPGPLGADGSMRLYGQGVLVNVLNPKTAFFVLAFLPQFVDPARGPIAGQVLVLGGLFAVLSVVTDSAYAYLAGSLGQYFQNNPRFWRTQRYVTGGIFLTLGAFAALARARK